MRVLSPCRRRQRQTPFAETTIPPQIGRTSSLAIRFGPRPGWPSEKATIRSSTNAGPAFARYLQVRFQGLRRDLADYLRYYG